MCSNEIPKRLTICKDQHLFNGKQGLCGLLLLHKSVMRSEIQNTAKSILEQLSEKRECAQALLVVIKIESWPYSDLLKLLFRV